MKRFSKGGSDEILLNYVSVFQLASAKKTPLNPGKVVLLRALSPDCRSEEGLGGTLCREIL